MPNEIVYLDLDKVNLNGWEGKGSKPKIDSFIKGIKAKDKIPPVWVYKIDDRTYQLTKLLKKSGEGKEGGHSRASAHYIAKEPLECVIKGRLEEVDLEWHKPINIRDIVLDDSKEAHDQFRKIKERDPNYR